MNERLRIACVAVVALLFLTAESCDSPPVIRILTPKPGLDVTYEPLLIEIDLWAFAKTREFEVLLNGVDITSEFVFEMAGPRRQATAIDVWGPGIVHAGTNDLVVQIEQWEVSRTFSTTGDAHADEVADFVPGTGAGFGQSELPDVVTGPPEGLGLFLGGLDVLSLGNGGVIELEFTDNVILDGPGVDFTVFENSFLTLVLGIVGNPFAEPGRVSVSQDGSTWFIFDACSTAPLDPPPHPGCAGVYPTLSSAADPLSVHPSIPSETPILDLVGLSQGQLVVPEGSGGDSFDLEDVGLAWARFVRIEDVGPGLGQAGSVGFDLDAVTAVNSGVPTDADQNGVPDAAE
ncbi:MAG: hypothetical protein VCC67_05375 [Myxococcota bacterium]